ncbi:MAG: DnaB-like helicase C-terminal domain-containing protein [Actinomycetes bacterium]
MSTSSGDSLRALLEGVDAGSLGAPDVAIPTGFTPLDQVLMGGVRTGQLTLVGGRPGIGKTILVLQWARRFALAGVPTAVVCYEHPPREVTERLLAIEVRMSARDDEQVLIDAARDLVRRVILAGEPIGTAAEHPLADEAIRRATHWGANLRIAGGSGRATDLEAIERIAEEIGSGGVVIVDYLQKVPLTGDHTTDDERSLAAAEGLKDIALRHNVAVVATAAGDHAGIEARRLRLGDLRGSAALAHECDVAITLNEKARAVSKVALAYNTARSDQFQRQVVMSIEKNRSGPADMHLEFRKDFSSYRFDPDGSFLGEKLVDDVLYEQ